MTDLSGYLRYKFPAHKEAGNECRVNCPQCHHHKNKCFINSVTGKGHCKHCGWRASGWANLIYSVENIKSKSEFSQWIKRHEVDIASPKLCSPAAARLPMDISLPYRCLPVDPDGPYCRYLYDRHIREKHIREYDIKQCDTGKYRGRLIFPVYENGNLVYFVDRAIDADSTYKTLGVGTDKTYWPIDKSGVVYNLHAHKYMHPTYITEGVLDAISIKIITGISAVALLGKDFSFTQVYKIIDKHRGPLIVCLDPDAGEQSIKLAELLSSLGGSTYIVTLTLGDPNDYLRSGTDLPEPVPFDSKFKIISRIKR